MNGAYPVIYNFHVTVAWNPDQLGINSFTFTRKSFVDVFLTNTQAMFKPLTCSLSVIEYVKMSFVTFFMNGGGGILCFR